MVGQSSSSVRLSVHSASRRSTLSASPYSGFASPGFASPGFASSSKSFTGSSGPRTQRSRSASNGTLATATPLGSFPPGQASVKNAVGQGNPVDFMRLDLTDSSRLRLVLANRSNSRLSAALLDATGAVATVRNGRRSLTVAAGQQGQTVFTGVKPGTYYLRIRSAASGTNPYEANLFVNRTSGPTPLPCGCGI